MNHADICLTVKISKMEEALLNARSLIMTLTGADDVLANAVLDVIDDAIDKPRQKGRPDARLIKAAPDLYEALKLLHDNIDEYQRINHLGGHDNHDMKMARAAMSKARGEEPK